MATLAQGEPRTIVVNPSGPLSNTLTAVLPPGVTISLESVLAAIDASGAGDTTALLEIADSSGAVIARKAQGQVVTGGTVGSATWALRLDDESAGAAASSGITKVSDDTLVVPGTYNVPNAFQAGFDLLEMHLWAKLPPGTYAGAPGTVRARFIIQGAVAHRWRLLAAGSFTNVSVAGSDGSSAVGYVPQFTGLGVTRDLFSYTRCRWFNYQSLSGFKDWISEGMSAAQTYAGAVGVDYVNRWTGGGWAETAGYPGPFGDISLRVYPNANPTTTGGAPDAGAFAAGSRLLVLGYTGS